MMMKILIENWKVLLLWKKMWRERRFMCVCEICGKKCIQEVRGMKPSSILKKVATSKTAEKLKKTVSPRLQIS